MLAALRASHVCSAYMGSPTGQSAGPACRPRRGCLIGRTRRAPSRARVASRPLPRMSPKAGLARPLRRRTSRQWPGGPGRESDSQAARLPRKAGIRTDGWGTAARAKQVSPTPLCGTLLRSEKGAVKRHRGCSSRAGIRLPVPGAPAHQGKAGAPAPPPVRFLPGVGARRMAEERRGRQVYRCAPPRVRSRVRSRRGSDPTEVIPRTTLCRRSRKPSGGIRTSSRTG